MWKVSSIGSHNAPNGYNDGYNLGCFDNNAPTIALDAFKIQ